MVSDASWEELLGSAVKKKVVVDGDGDVPEFGSVVVYNWRGSILREESPDGDGSAHPERGRSVFGERQQATTRIGDGDEIPGVELALRHMRIGQQCLVRCESRFAYGSDGCPATRKEDVELPPNSDIEVWIELLGVQSTKTVSDMNLEETIAEGDRKKMVGNGHFERKAYKKALRAYTSAANTVAGLDFPNEDADAFREARQLRIDCGNNMATTCVRLGDLEKAKEAAVGVLELDPVNAKALFRAGQVSSLQSNFAEASLALQKARALNPDSKEIRAELQRLSTRRKAYEKKRQAMQESMARSLVPGSSRAEPPRDVSSSVAGAARPANAEKEPVCPVDDKAKPLVRDRFRGVLYPLLVVLVAWGVSYLLPRTAQRV